jgi:nucleotide-binding universal stress UspA family protein
MYREIMVPVDLAHEDKLAHALEVAADLARHWGARITYVGVTSPVPGALGHNPGEFARKLTDFAAAQGARVDVATRAHPAIAHDPATEVDDALLRAIDETGADLVVMQSHIPGLVDYVWPSNGGKIAGHAKASVMVVRG